MPKLTWRQGEIVSMRQSLMTYKEIARVLGISPSTVKGHILRAYARGAPRVGHAPRDRDPLAERPPYAPTCPHCRGTLPTPVLPGEPHRVPNHVAHEKVQRDDRKHDEPQRDLQPNG